MTIEELGANEALLKELKAESLKLIEAGMEPTEAKIKVFREHGVAIPEDEVKADAVSRMSVDEETLEAVSGGTFLSSASDSCYFSHSCYAAFLHDRKSEDQDCWSSYHCRLLNNTPDCKDVELDV